ncbi:MAG: redoxin domain-containing protein [Bacteroidota bacterium]
MRRKLLFLLAPFILFACQQEESYKIEGQLKGLNDGEITLKNKRDGKWNAIDSTKAEDGVFSFDGKIESPEMYVISVDTLGVFKVFVENSDIKIKGHTDSLNNLDIKGSEIHNSFAGFKKKVGEYDREINNLYDDYKTAKQDGKDERADEIEEEYQAVSDNKIEYIKQFVKDRTNSVLSPYITSRYLLPYIKFQELDSTYKSLDSLVKKSRYAKKLKERRDLLSRVQVGKPFIDFTLPNPEGEELTFSDYIGDGYVLLDFWASWCSPCRKENPNLVENYNKYKDKGFEIFGVSLDENEKAWKRAIEKDNLTWPQVSDLEGWSSDVSQEYGVMSIPSNVLIDKEGKIVARNLRGEELDEKLEEIYEKK